MDKIRKSLIVITVLTFFYGLYYWGIPSLINIEKRMPVIEEKILQKTGYKLSVKEPYIKMGHIPAIWLMAEDISLLNDDGTKAFNLKHSAVKVYLLPLLAGKIQIGNFSCDRINADLTYTKNSELKIGQYPLKKLPESQMELTKAYIRLGEYEISLDDLKQNKKILLDGNYLTIDEFQNNKRLKLSTFAKLYVNKKASEIMADIDIKLPINIITEDQFKINGRIVNLDLKDLSEYAKAIPDSKIKSLSGLVNLVADTTTTPDKHKNIFAKLSIDNLGILQEETARSIYCKDKLNIRMDIDTIRNGINIRNMTIIADGIDINSNGKITKLDAKIPNLDMNIAINKSRTESFIPLMPGEKNLLEEVDFYALKNNFFYGDITGNLKVKGRADTPDVTGKILVTEGYLIKPLLNNTAKATIKLAFTGQKMYMDAKVPASTTQTVFVNGDVELYGTKNADLYIKSTSEVDLKIAQTVLNPLHEILKFDLGPVPIMDIHGIGNVNLHVIGTRKNPHAWGIFNFKNTTAEFLEIHNMVLKNGSGKLVFSDQDTKFDTDTAELNGKPVNVSGTCTLKGVLNFDIIAKQQDLGNMLKIIKTSPMLSDIRKLVSPITGAKGLSDIKINLTGTVIDVNDVVFNKNIFAKGAIDLYSVMIKAQNIPLSNVTGKISFNNLDTGLDLSSNLAESKIKINGRLNDKNANLKIISDKFVLKDGLKLLNINIPYKEDIGKIHTSFTANYNGEMEKINPAKLSVKGKIYESKSKNISIENAYFDLNNSNLKISPLKGIFKNNKYLINISAYRILTPQQTVNGNFYFPDFDLTFLNELKKYLNKNLQDIDKINGKITIKGYIKDNNIYFDSTPDNISFVYLPSNIIINILSGDIRLKKDLLVLNKINSTLGQMPVFTDGKIYNIDKNPIFDVYINAKPTQEFLDQFFNKSAVYPVKLNGDINFSTTLSGSSKALRNRTQLKLAENAGIYYMGATLGNTRDAQGSNAVNIYIDNTIYPNGIRINNLQYDRLIPSQNNKIYTKPQLNASGSIGILSNNDIKFTNFRVKTQEPTDAKIFNILFRKPLMKQGIFTSDITINGTATEPVILGELNITSIDMPLFDATIKDVELNFKRDLIYLKSKGSVLTNNLNISAIMKNNPKLPFVFEDIKIYLETLDLNRIVAEFQDFEAESSRNLSGGFNTSLPDIKQIIIKKAEVFANNIKIKNLEATKFKSQMALNEKGIFNVSGFEFIMAEGIVKGRMKYDFNNGFVNLIADISNANAQIISETLFDLKGQVFGSITGSTDLSCIGKSHDACFSTLNGFTEFNVKDGRMPKLGSLEYLLKAGNLVKGGITGLSINGIIDLITPYKTGNFDSISGQINITNGIADNIQIFSAGKDLNMYLKGSYNFTNLMADMQIFGALTKNFSTLFGKIGNASLNTLFNTIPGINVSEAPSVITEDIKKIPNTENNAARMFAVDIYGDINGDDYVRSFKWLK